MSFKEPCLLVSCQSQDEKPMEIVLPLVGVTVSGRSAHRRAYCLLAQCHSQGEVPIARSRGEMPIARRDACWRNAHFGEMPVPGRNALCKISWRNAIPGAKCPVQDLLAKCRNTCWRNAQFGEMTILAKCLSQGEMPSARSLGEMPFPGRHAQCNISWRNAIPGCKISWRHAIPGATCPVQRAMPLCQIQINF